MAVFVNQCDTLCYSKYMYNSLILYSLNLIENLNTVGRGRPPI